MSMDVHEYWENIRRDNRDKTADLLEETARRFETGQYAWGVGAFETLDGELCYLGGLHMTETEDAENGGFYSDRAAVLSTTYLKVFHGIEREIWNWNDQMARGMDEVVDLMKHVAKAVRNEEI